MENGLSDFMKLAYKFKKVKDVHEAFKEYPPENEWHKGDAELYLKEDMAEYNIYSIGDIVFVKDFIYPDNTDGHDHLFVIIDQNNIVVPIENFGMLISSQLDKLKYNSNELLKKDEQNRLHKDSIVKTDVIYKIENDKILFKIGSIDLNTIAKYKIAFLENNALKG